MNRTTHAKSIVKQKLDWDLLFDRWREEGYESLSGVQKVWLTTRGLIDSVNDGGIVSYFYNHDAEFYNDAILALEILDAIDAQRVLLRVGALFGEQVPTGWEERNEIINSWPDDGEQDRVMDKADKEFDSLFDALEASLEKYLIANGLDPRTYVD